MTRSILVAGILGGLFAVAGNFVVARWFPSVAKPDTPASSPPPQSEARSVAEGFVAKLKTGKYDEFLDDVTLYWLTNTATSAARLYWETAGQSVLLSAAQMTSEISLPVAISVFPQEVYRAPETWARRAYRNLIYFNEVEKAATSRPGKNRSCSAPSSAPRSGRFGRHADHLISKKGTRHVTADELQRGFAGRNEETRRRP